jgi:hypothetical protein
MSEQKLSDAVTIQAFAERMAERSDKVAAELLEGSDMVGSAVARARAEAFWIMRNYIQDSHIEDWSNEQ